MERNQDEVFNAIGSLLGLSEDDTPMTRDFESTVGRPPRHPYEVADFESEEDIDTLIEAAVSAVKEEKDHVNPKHYYIIPPEAFEKHPEGLQYQHLMFYLLEGHEPRVANLLAQVFKYLMRAGKKDEIRQELRKSKWYLDHTLEEVLDQVIDFYND